MRVPFDLSNLATGNTVQVDVLCVCMRVSKVAMLELHAITSGIGTRALLIAVALLLIFHHVRQKYYAAPHSW